MSWTNAADMNSQVQFLEPALSEATGFFFYYDFKFKGTYIIERRYPEQLSVALAQVGGLLALFKIVSMMLKEYHRRLFERDYSPKQRVVQTDIDGTMCLEG